MCTHLNVCDSFSVCKGAVKVLTKYLSMSAIEKVNVS